MAMDRYRHSGPTNSKPPQRQGWMARPVVWIAAAAIIIIVLYLFLATAGSHDEIDDDATAENPGAEQDVTPDEEPPAEAED